MNPLSQIRTDLANLLRPDIRSQLQTTKAANTATTPFADALNPLLKAADTNSGTSQTAGSNSTLGRDAFLQLLVQQMQYQDPLEPQDNTQMIAQLAQFSSLEQMQNLNDGFQTFEGNIDQLNFISASALVGKHVVGVDTAGKAVDGTVDSVQLNGSVVYMTVGSQTMSMAGVQSMRAA